MIFSYVNSVWRTSPLGPMQCDGLPSNLDFEGAHVLLGCWFVDDFNFRPMRGWHG